MTKTLLKKITLYVGALSMFVVGVVYMLMSDLTFNNTASRLIVAVLLAFGSAILFFLSDNFNEKPVIRYLFKGLGLALAAGFVLYIHLFMVSDYFLEVLDTFRKAGISKASDLAATEATVIIALVIGYVAIAAQIVNVVFTVLFKED